MLPLYWIIPQNMGHTQGQGVSQRRGKISTAVWQEASRQTEESCPVTRPCGTGGSSKPR